VPGTSIIGIGRAKCSFEPHWLFCCNGICWIYACDKALYIDEEKLMKISILDGGTAIQQRIASNQRMLVIFAG
jgi:hypothetical protein